MREKTKNNQGKSLLAILIAVVLLLIIIACGALYYFMVYSNTEQIYKRLIDSSINAYQETAQKEEYKTVSTKIGASLNIDLEEKNEQTQKIVDLINSLDIQLGTQMDRENKKMMVKLESNYENDPLLNADIYADVEKEKMYMYLDKIFEKYVEIDMDEETSKSLSEIFEATYTKQNKENSEKSINIIKEELKKVIKPEYCSSEKQEITINNKKVKATKSTITMTNEQLADEFITLFTNLKNNQEFLNCYENSEEIVEMFEELINQLEDAKKPYNKMNFKISLYTTGISQKVQKVEAEAENDDEIIKVEINNIDENNSEISVSYNKDTISVNNIVKANIKKISETESDIAMEINIPDTAKVALNLDISYKINEEMEEFDDRNTVNIEDITEEDTKEMIERFSKTKLYELINELSGGLFNNYMLNGNQQNNNNEDNYDEELENWLNENNYNEEDEENYNDDFLTMPNEEQM